MHIQVGHAGSYDFQKELYLPLQQSSLAKEHVILFPHADGNENGLDSKTTLQSVDLFLAEVSYPSTGLGIELGFASMYKIPIICIAKQGSSPSSSIFRIVSEIVFYTNGEDMITKVEQAIKHLNTDK